MDGIFYPVKLRDIDRFENLNENISVNVSGYEEKKIFPVRITNAKGRQHHVNLLVITGNESHYFILIKSLNRLLVGNVRNIKGDYIFVRAVYMDVPPNMYWTIIRKYVNCMERREFDYLKEMRKMIRY